MIKKCFAGALLVLGAISSFAAPIPLSAVGVGKSIKITGHPYNVLGGGGFSAEVDGFDTTVWCVDSQNTVSVGAMYIANVTLLSDWTGGQNTLVRKGTNASWSDLNTLTPLQRYEAAAYLLEQFSGFPDGPNADNAASQDIQRAIWRMTYQTGAGGDLPAVNADYNTAKSFIENPLNIDFGKGSWAVISGSVDGRGGFTGTSYQTFMVQVAGPEVPEPATYGLMGAALLGLTLIRRRALQK